MTLAVLIVILGAVAAESGQAARPVADRSPTILPDAPPPPVPPATVSRDAAGRATVRAVRLSTPLRIDGHLDETIYAEVPPISDFIQNDPKEGAPATEKTEVWIFFDDKNFYVVGRCWESRPELVVANEMRRDNTNIVQNDQFSFAIDPFYDRRNMLLFEISPVGGRIDGQVTNERQISLDWNPIWEVKARRFEEGYIVEAAVPFKSIRYRQGTAQVWGFQARRHNTAKNEYSFLTALPASVGGQGTFRASLAATLVGIEAPASSRNIDIKPYATANLTSDRTARPAIDNDPGGDVGVDAKYAVTQSLLADFTINTDFAQVEADEQQVNLTRFNLFFPEKREFFLENAGIFSFGAATTVAGAAGDTPLMFYSRNIGLFQGREVPLRAGGRLSGRAGRFTIGALNVQSGDEVVSGARATNFSVVRVRRDILRRSNIGVIATNRSVGSTGLGANRVYGADGSLAFGPDLVISSYWAQSQTDGAADGNNRSYRAFLDYTADRYGAQVDNLRVDSRFDPQLGFSRRRDLQKNLVQGRFSPRPKNNRLVRKYSYQATFTNIENTAGRLETRTLEGRFGIDLQNSDTFSLTFTDNYEFLPEPFRIAPLVVLPVGGYDFNNGRIQYNFGRQRNISGNVSVDYGTFYDGHKTTWSVSSGRFNVNPQLSLEPSVSINEVDVSAGSFTTRLFTTRVTYTMTPLMFTSALLQYNSGANTFATNVRFRWEYTPGSELFLVYNDQRDTLVPAFPDLVNRAFVVKINRLFRF